MDISLWNNLPSSFKSNLFTSLLFPATTSAEPKPPSWAEAKLAAVLPSLRALLPPWPSRRGGPPPRRSPPPTVFRPYVAKVPWHGGVRAFLSQLFPRYGHYCGPNWSSGKDGGSLLWDKRPIDWLDLCCYCHDIGYDTHDQEKLLQADLAFLHCLERPRMATKGDPRAAHLYRSMCIYGLRNILIPYRMQLVKNPFWMGGWSAVEMMNGWMGKNPFWRAESWSFWPELRSIAAKAFGVWSQPISIARKMGLKLS